MGETFVLKHFHCHSGFIKVMAKAANIYSVVLAYEAQTIKLSNYLLVLRLSFFTLTCSSKVSMIIKWADRAPVVKRFSVLHYTQLYQAGKGILVKQVGLWQKVNQ